MWPSILGAHIDAVHRCSHSSYYLATHIKNNERTNPIYIYIAILPTLPSLDLATKHMPTFFHNPCDGNNYLLRNNSIGWNPVLNGSDQHLKAVSVSTFTGSLSRRFDFCSFCSHICCYFNSHFKNNEPQTLQQYYPHYQVLFTPCDRSNYPLEPTPLTEHPVLNGSDQHLKAVSVSTLSGSLS